MKGNKYTHYFSIRNKHKMYTAHDDMARLKYREEHDDIAHITMG